MVPADAIGSARLRGGRAEACPSEVKPEILNI
jgi:hypothetical protein